MENMTYKIDVNAVIHLSNEEDIELSTNKVGSIAPTNYIKSIEITKTKSASGANPIGVPCSIQGTMILVSSDKSLQPENPDSEYYGYMNSSAFINMTYRDDELDEDDDDLPFGQFYVEDWYSNIDSDSLTEITIEFIGVMTQLNKSPAPYINIEKNKNIKQFLSEIISKWNSTVDSKYALSFNAQTATFGPFETMPYSDIDSEYYGDLLCALAQSTLTNIFINENNEVLTDYYFDDEPESAVCEIKDTTNAYQYSVGEGLLVKYGGVKVNYSNIIVNNVAAVTSLSGQVLVADNDTVISNIDVGGKLFKLNYVQVTCENEDVFIEVKDITYNKKYVSLTLYNPSDSDVTVSIIIFGQTINNNAQALEYGKEPKLELTNTLLGKNDCITFAQNMNEIINSNESSLDITGYFNPRIKLGDIVEVDLQAIGRSGYYKVHEIKQKIENGLVTTLKLYTLLVQDGGN